LVTLEKIFDIQYGNSLNLNQLKQVEDGVNFVSRTAKNNGVSAIVKQLENEKSMPIGSITVSLGGSVLEAFVQDKPYYTGYHIYCLTEKEGIKLTAQQKLYYCMSIRANKYRYSYGRQANRTLRNLLVPSVDEIPKWVEGYDVSRFDDAFLPHFNKKIDLNFQHWKEFKYDELFDIERGRGPRRKDLDGSGNTPFVSSSDTNNGLTAVTTMSPIHKGNAIGVNRNGSVAEAFYQKVAFCSTEDVHIFYPKFELNEYVAMFLNTLIKKEAYRYNYGRKWGMARMRASTIKLPVDIEGNIDLKYMENYIKTLPFSSSI